MLVKRIAACTMRLSLFLLNEHDDDDDQSIFNRFPVIQPVSSKVRHFSTFLHILAYTGYAPGTIAVNVTWMERGFNAGQTHSSIYPSIFNSLRAML